METYYTRKEYNEMKNALTRKLKAAEKKIQSLETKLAASHVTEKNTSSED